VGEVFLELVQLTKRYYAHAAVSDVSLRIHRGEIHAIIGPNGAGKTTLINVLSGDLPPTSGTVRFKGQDVTGLSSDRISRLGIGRSYQQTNVFPSLSCLDNCWLAAQSRARSSMRFVWPAHRLSRVREHAERALATCGLGGRELVPAADLSYGEQRQLELAMMLATEPELLLLDEPLAGMGSEEAAAVTALLRRLAEKRTIVLVEHDMDAVFAIANRITVMVAGQILETGDLEQIRNSRAVQEAYLGIEGAAD
jgi:branched-chain amino acid transport system ATP-binding protein